MYKKINYSTGIKINNSIIGEPIELKVRRIMKNNEPINETAPLIYTERKEGVLPSYDIRTDRFDAAIDAMDRYTKATIAKRDELPKTEKEPEKPGELPGAKPGELPGTKPGELPGEKPGKNT